MTTTKNPDLLRLRPLASARPEKSSRWIQLGGGLAAVALMAGGVKYLVDYGKNTERTRQQNEAGFIDDLRSGEVKSSSVRQSMIVLREGAKIRTTPDLVSESELEDGNVWRTVGKDEKMVIVRPVVYKDRNTKEWLGVWVDEAGTSGNEPDGKVSSEEVAGHMVWISADVLDQVDGTGEPYAEEHHFTGDPRTQGSFSESLHLGDDGTVRDGDALVALGVFMSPSDAEKIVQTAS